MNKRILVAVAVTVLSAMQAAWAQPPTVTVTLVGRDIQVDRDPIIVTRSMGQRVPIRWQLPPKADYVFDPAAIRVEGKQDQILPNACSGGPKHFTCINENTRLGELKYTIRILDSNRNLIEKDPRIVNQ